LRVVVSEQADADASSILVYLTSKAGYAIAEQYILALDELYERLASYPKSGAPRPELGPQARICLVAPYVVVYDTNPNTVTILRVLHGHRDMTRALLLPPLGCSCACGRKPHSANPLGS
jgi:toxin ParE1/3/4